LIYKKANTEQHPELASLPYFGSCRITAPLQSRKIGTFKILNSNKARHVPFN
jgi:hypothetical protein